MILRISWAAMPPIIEATLCNSTSLHRHLHQHQEIKWKLHFSTHIFQLLAPNMREFCLSETIAQQLCQQFCFGYQRFQACTGITTIAFKKLIHCTQHKIPRYPKSFLRIGKVSCNHSRVKVILHLLGQWFHVQYFKGACRCIKRIKRLKTGIFTKDRNVFICYRVLVNSQWFQQSIHVTLHGRLILIHFLPVTNMQMNMERRVSGNSGERQTYFARKRNLECWTLSRAMYQPTAISLHLQAWVWVWKIANRQA